MGMKNVQCCLYAFLPFIIEICLDHATMSSNMPTFLGLPGEIRNIIYNYAFSIDAEIIPFPSGEDREKPEAVSEECYGVTLGRQLVPFTEPLHGKANIHYSEYLPCIALLAVSKGVRAECLKIFLSTNAFRYPLHDRDAEDDPSGNPSINPRDIWTPFCSTITLRPHVADIKVSRNLQFARYAHHTSNPSSGGNVLRLREDLHDMQKSEMVYQWESKLYHFDLMRDPRKITIDVFNTTCPGYCCRTDLINHLVDFVMKGVETAIVNGIEWGGLQQNRERGWRVSEAIGPCGKADFGKVVAGFNESFELMITGFWDEKERKNLAAWAMTYDSILPAWMMENATT